MKSKRIYICTKCGAIGHDTQTEKTVTNDGCLVCGEIDTNIDAYVAALMNPCRREEHFVSIEKQVRRMDV